MSSRRCAVFLTDEARVSLVDASGTNDYERVRSMLGTLSSFPEIREVYDPVYEAALPPEPCRVIYAGRYGVYYVFDKGKDAVTILAIEDQRRNPRTRFRLTE